MGTLCSVPIRDAYHIYMLFEPCVAQTPKPQLECSTALQSKTALLTHCKSETAISTRLTTRYSCNRRYLSTFCCRHCTELLQERTTPKSKPADVIQAWLTEHHLPMCSAFLLQNHIHSSILRSAVPDIAAQFLQHGVRLGDLEWFSRAAMLRDLLQVSMPTLLY